MILYHYTAVLSIFIFTEHPSACILVNTLKKIIGGDSNVKKASIILCAVILLAIAGLPLHAVGGDVLKGAPAVDGVLDDIYLQSYSYTINPTDNFVYAAGMDAADIKASATTYFLWDDQYIYVCVVVSDTNVVTVGADVINGQDYTWQNDVTELWFNFTGEQMLINHDPYNTRITGSPTVNGSEGYKAKAAITGSGYVNEFAIPRSNKAGDTFNLSTQINDMQTVDPMALVCYGEQRSPHEFKLSAKEVEYPAEEIPEETAEEIAGTAPAITAPPQTAASPQTADFASISVLALAAAAAAAAAAGISKLRSKRKR